MPHGKSASYVFSMPHGGSNPPPATNSTVWFQWVEPISTTGSVTLNPNSQPKFQRFFTHSFTQPLSSGTVSAFLSSASAPLDSPNPCRFGTKEGKSANAVRRRSQGEFFIFEGLPSRTPIRPRPVNPPAPTCDRHPEECLRRCSSRIVV